jgi:hypothetical protein
LRLSSLWRMNLHPNPKSWKQHHQFLNCQQQTYISIKRNQAKFSAPKLSVQNHNKLKFLKHIQPFFSLKDTPLPQNSINGNLKMCKMRRKIKNLNPGHSH